MRTYVHDKEFLDESNFAERTKLLLRCTCDYLVSKGHDEEEAMVVAEKAFELAVESAKTKKSDKKIGIDKDKKTKYLLYLAKENMDLFAQICHEQWDLLSMIIKPSKGSDKKALKQNEKKLGLALAILFDGKKAVDLALFGRMLADLADKNVEASCQVAHAISTNTVKMEMDFYTAVDDLNTREDTGAGMMGVVEFNSACFYRYLVIDTRKLVQNLDGDAELASRGLRAFLRAAILAIPTGKQNSMAALTPPSYVQSIVRDGGEPWNLANAFISPVQSGEKGGEDLVNNSIKVLEKQLKSLKTMYGENGKKAFFILGPRSETNLDALLDGVLAAVWS